MEIRGSVIGAGLGVALLLASGGFMAANAANGEPAPEAVPAVVETLAPVPTQPVTVPEVVMPSVTPEPVVSTDPVVVSGTTESEDAVPNLPIPNIPDTTGEQGAPTPPPVPAENGGWGNTDPSGYYPVAS